MRPISWLGCLLRVRLHVTATALDGQLDLELALAVQCRDLQLGVVHLDARGRRDVSGRDVARALLAQVHDDRLVVLARDDELLDVQDDLGDVFLDTGHCRELVQHAFDADAGDGRAGDRRQQGAAKRVAERVAEAWLEWFDDETRADVVDAVFTDGRALCDEHDFLRFSGRPLYDAASR